MFLLIFADVRLIGLHRTFRCRRFSGRDTEIEKEFSSFALCLFFFSLNSALSFFSIKSFNFFLGWMRAQMEMLLDSWNNKGKDIFFCRSKRYKIETT